jgi:hypothetical protein
MTFGAARDHPIGGMRHPPDGGLLKPGSGDGGKRGPVGTPFTAPIDQLAFVVGGLDRAIRGWVDPGVGSWLALHNGN